MVEQAKTGQQAKMGKDEVVLGWHAREWMDHEKGSMWWTVAGILVVLVVVISLIYGSWTTAVVFALLAGTYYLLAHERAEVVEVSVTELGVRFGEKFWQYANIKEFWLVYDPPRVTTLHLEIREGKFKKEIVIQMEDVNPLDVRDALSQQIPEAEGMEEGALDQMARVLKI